VNWEHS
jgi:hypothetical protein